MYFRCTTVRYSPSFKDVTDANATSIAKKLLEVVVDMNLCDNPVLFHVFSNGGCKIYSCMRRELENNPYYEDITKLGVLYDSAPGNLSINQQVASVTSNLQANLWTSLLKIACYVSLSFAYGLRRILHLFGQTVHETLYDRMMYYQDGCPEIYLYSKADEIVKSSDVDNMIEKRRIQGVDITAICWVDSSHVQHFRLHQEDYTKNCYDFLSKCIIASLEGEYVDLDYKDK